MGPDPQREVQRIVHETGTSTRSRRERGGATHENLTSAPINRTTFEIFIFEGQNISAKINFAPLKVMSRNIKNIFSST